MGTYHITNKVGWTVEANLQMVKAVTLWFTYSKTYPDDGPYYLVEDPTTSNKEDSWNARN